jgi:hypothetical protein
MEEWREIPGYEGLYEASTEGRIRSLPRKTLHYTGKVIVRGGRMLNGCVTPRGYVKVSLCVAGRVKGEHIHSLVAATFIGPRPLGLLVRHFDGNPANNRLENLLYGTGAENMADAAAHGTLRRGETHNMAKLTEHQVSAIRRLHRVHTYKQLAQEFGVSVNQVDNIVNRRQWKHVL